MYRRLVSGTDGGVYTTRIEAIQTFTCFYSGRCTRTFVSSSPGYLPLTGVASLPSLLSLV